jgi:5-methyltetrahydrofolate--homocysteine methyltransferase
MVGPEMFRRFILPALEEETEFLDHTVYHYDGPGALVHLKDILSLPKLGAIQWTPGSGAKPFIQWMDLLKEIQKAGKAVWVACSPEEIPAYHRELKPELVYYQCGAKTEAQARQTIDWLVKNT